MLQRVLLLTYNYLDTNEFNNLITSTRESSPDNQIGDGYTKKQLKVM